MDFLRRRRQSSSHSFQGLVESSTGSSTTGSSPASSIYEFKSDGFGSIIPKSLRRSSSRASTTQTPLLGGEPSSPGRRVLHKSKGSFSSFESMKRRGSMASTDGHGGRLSRAATTLNMTLSAPSSPTSIDWKTQHVEAHSALEADPQALRSKPAYTVVTRDYIVKMKNWSDAVAAFPQLGTRVSQDSLGPTPEPLLTIPIHTIISVFHAESDRPQFGLEVCWKSSSPKVAFGNAQFFFGHPHERSDHMAKIVQQVKAKNSESQAIPAVPLEVEAQIMQIFASEEPDYQSCKPEIFPVVRRAWPREDGNLKSSDKAKRAQDGWSWYLAVGRNLCYFVELGRGPGASVDFRYQAFGLVNLESFLANWTFHEERFVLVFREPFKPAITLELASRCYRQIIMTFMKADRFLKPCWPSMWQTMEVFSIPGLTDPQLLVAGDNYGGVKRTLDAYLSGYRSSPVEWEINWRTAFAPEFRLLPPKTGSNYSELQLLAVFRALRYNDYFNSISFRDIDVSGLWNRCDEFGKTNIPYLSRNCMALGETECVPLRFGSVLHQEIHALAFCSETTRQIDLSNCFPEPTSRQDLTASATGLGLLAPILNLLELGMTKCNRILLSGNCLRSPDIEALLEATISANVEIQALDLSRCSLNDLALRDLFEALFHQGRSLQFLDVSGNCGYVRASVISQLSYTLLDLRKLNVSGLLMADIPGPLLSFETLSRFESLEELDLSRFKVNEATIDALERFLSQKLLPQEPRFIEAESQIYTSKFRKLALNTCGINGREAARLVRALKNHRAAHLHINDNPLEDGIDDLCRAIGLTIGPAGLHLNMIEFRDEGSYVQLIKALTLNKHISFLSLVGTAPTPVAEHFCGTETCNALEQFFASNKSIRFLDMSGYCGKLDEGQLGKGFGRSLLGLTDNDTLTHLRVRNQDLKDDVGTVGSIIRQNSTLRMVDCQNNGWNFTSAQFLVKSLELSKTILEFPFSPREYDRVWKRMVGDVRRTNLTLNKAAVQAQQQEQERLLGNALHKHTLELQDILKRNRDAAEAECGSTIDMDDSIETGGEPGWPSLEHRAAHNGSSTATTPMALQAKDDPMKKAAVPAVDNKPPHSTVKSDAVEPNTSITAPYHVVTDDLETPPSHLSPSSETPTTPELQSPTTPPDSTAASPRVGNRDNDMGPYFNTVFSRFRIGGLEAHVEE